MIDNAKKLIVTDGETDARIHDGIEKYRKGDFCIRADVPVVKVTLKKHKFRFGCNLFMLDEFPDDAGKNAVYEQKFKEIFNMATLPFYWNATEPEEGRTRYAADSAKMYRRPAVDLCMNWCEQNAIEPREHALCYEHNFPKWLAGRSTEEVKRRLDGRMREIAKRYKDRIRTIEVTNEMYWDDGVTGFFKSPDFMTFCYERAAEYFPENQLCINEWTGAIWDAAAAPWDPYYALIENLLLKGARIDAIGMQFHMFYAPDEYFAKTRKCYDIAHDLKIMDNYARFGKPLQITEITVPSYTQLPEDEQTQADIIEKLYSMWFSHPLTEQIIYWNMVDGYAYGTRPGDMNAGENVYRGGLLRFDMSEKPAYRRLKHLVRDVWTTREEIEVKNGEAHFRGFYGEYEVEAGGRKFNVEFNEDGKQVRL